MDQGEPAPSEIHPTREASSFAILSSRAKLAAAGDRCFYRELDDFTDLIGRTRRVLPKCQDRYKGVLPEQIYLDYSQDRLAAYGLTFNLKDILARAISRSPGVHLRLAPSASRSIHPANSPILSGGNVIIGASSSAAQSLFTCGSGADLTRYQSPAKYLNYFTWADKDGKWHRSRAVTVAVR
jgi:hypothetical protein